MKQELNKLRDYQKVLNFVQSMVPQLGNAKPARAFQDEEKNESAEPLMNDGVQITFVAGTIKDGEQDRMKKLLFRVTRGKALTYFNEYVQDGVAKSAYMVVY